MTTLRIARLRKRYRLPHGDADARTRIDDVIASALHDGVLDAAVDRVTDGDREEVCVRRLAITTRLRAGDDDERNAAAWSIAVSDALQAALRDGHDVVRYGSRHHAVADMVARAPLGTVERAWAWRQLGLWTNGEAPTQREAANEVLAMLTREPRTAVATLHATAIAAPSAVHALIRLGAAPRWRALAVAALAQAHAPHDILSACDESVGTSANEVREAARAEQRASAPADALTEVLRAALRSLPVAEREAIATSVAVIAMLVREPSLATKNVERVVERLHVMRALVLEQAPLATSTPERAHASPAAPRAVEPDDEDSDDVDERPRGHTDIAGLLFVLHLVRAIDLPLRVAASSALRDRPTRWVLHRLAVESLGTRDDDAGALAFAGLAPNAPLPSADEPPCTSDERDALLALRDRLAATLRVWLGEADEPDDARLFAHVCHRRGEIAADPAWIDVRLPLESVDPSVRRAGLDLDPGWCPWIGCVVRIVYV